MAKPKNKISEDLKMTLLSNPRIDKVHFRADGHHYFEAYRHEKSLYGFISTNNVMIKGQKVEQKIPMFNTLVVETVSREDILGFTPEVAPNPTV